MTQLRDPVSPWLDLQAQRHPRRYRRLRFWLPLLAVLGSLLAVAALWQTAGQRTFQAGPLSTAHAFFNHDCSQCHTQTFQPFTRFIHGNDHIRSVPDENCTKCHPGSIHQVNQKLTPNCASCHREHQGKPELARVSDGHCAACHGDLNAAHRKEHADFASFTSVTAHPEFRIWQQGGRDPGTIRFNHQKHLAERVFTVLRSESPDEERPWRKLRCDNCHRLDDAGRYMRPVKYEQHCKECHPLNVLVFGEWKDEGVQKAADEFRRLPAPHERPEVVHAELRERYTRFSRRVHGAPAPPPEPPIPGLSRRPEITSKEQWEWVEQQLGQAEKLLFAQKEAGCQYCHGAPGLLREDGLPVFRPSLINERPLAVGVRADDLSGQSLATSLSPNLRLDYPVSARWLPHSRFHHEAHRMFDCAQCHANAITSSLTSDLLLPHMTDCTKCHNPQTGVRFDCATCHTYHNLDMNGMFRGKHTIKEAGAGRMEEWQGRAKGPFHSAVLLPFISAREGAWPSK